MVLFENRNYWYNKIIIKQLGNKVIFGWMEKKMCEKKDWEKERRDEQWKIIKKYERDRHQV